MKLSLRSTFFALPLVVLAAITGCAASPAGEDVADATGAATASQPITVANYASHPKIKAIRDQVQAIDAMNLTKATNPGCDGSNDKFTDASGKIRKFVATGGEGGFSGTTIVYYNADGAPLFIFSKEADWTGEGTGDSKVAALTQARTYFDVTNGSVLIQAVRKGTGTDPDVTLTSPDQAAGEVELIENSSAYEDPMSWYSSTGCGGDGFVEEPGKK